MALIAPTAGGSTRGLSAAMFADGGSNPSRKKNQDHDAKGQQASAIACIDLGLKFLWHGSWCMDYWRHDQPFEIALGYFFLGDHSGWGGGDELMAPP